MKIKRGDIISVSLDPSEGSEQRGERPCVVISPDIINENSPVIIIAAITSKKTDKVYPFEAILDPSECCVKQKSKVLLLHVRSIDKKRILKKYGTLPPYIMEKIEEALKVATGLKDL